MKSYRALCFGSFSFRSAFVGIYSLQCFSKWSGMLHFEHLFCPSKIAFFCSAFFTNSEYCFPKKTGRVVLLRRPLYIPLDRVLCTLNFKELQFPFQDAGFLDTPLLITGRFSNFVSWKILYCNFHIYAVSFLHALKQYVFSNHL